MAAPSEATLKNYPLLRTLALYRQMPWRFMTTALLFAAANFGLIAQQYVIGHTVNEIQQGHAVSVLADGSFDASVAWFWFFCLAAIAISRGALQYIAGLFSLMIGQDMLCILRERILQQVQGLDLAWHWRHGMGEIVTRTTRDADKLRDALINFWRQLFETVLVVIAAVFMLCWYNLALGIVPLLLTVAGLAVFVFLTNQLVILDREVGQAYDNVSQDLSEGVHGVRVIKAFGLEQGRIDRFNLQVDQFIHHAFQAVRYAASRLPLPQIIVAMSYVWVLGFGAYLISIQKLNVGELVAALLMTNMLVFRVEGIGQVMHIFADARASAGRIWEMLDATPTIISGSQKLWIDDNKSAHSQPIGIQLRNVSVSSQGGQDILHACNLTIHAGEMVAIVGMTGSGKSTLLGLLPRLLDPQQGQVRVGSDATGWQNVQDLHITQLRQLVQVVPQESFLFSDSLAQNLRVAKHDATDDELYAALHHAAADDVISRLDRGLDTTLGDRGVTLSGGQKQRLSLARALLSDAKIIAFDDATSALDAATEKRILDQLKEEVDLSRQPPQATQQVACSPVKKTIIVVSSKLSTILMADRVILLGQGRVLAEGTHQQLSQHNHAYRELMGLNDEKTTLSQTELNQTQLHQTEPAHIENEPDTMRQPL